jgi:nitrate/TMAO reductase-like tetraheme cytochrome c subunit
MRRLRAEFPRQAYNLITLLGVGIALFAFAAIVILYGMSLLRGETNPYLGIVMLVGFPGVLVLGLLLIPLGMWRERRRIARGQHRPMIVDLGLSAHRNAVIFFIAGTSIFLLMTTVGMYQTYEFTESNTFCGEVCHQTMTPEYTAWADSPHARVHCVDCHVGPGFDWFVKAKLNGARQLWGMVIQEWPTPIPTPIHNLRPARETCEHCHWPGKSYASKEVVEDYFLGDEANTHWRVRLLLHVGETSEANARHAWGIHWHVDAGNVVTYVSEDHDRMSIQQVTWSEGEREMVYTRDGLPLPDSVLVRAEAEGRRRRMDCIDCHNRPSHQYGAPNEIVNDALASGRLDPGLPFIKREATGVLSTEYFTREGGRDSIAVALRSRYDALGVELPETAVEAVIALFDRHMFPSMRVRWDRYPTHANHFRSAGCFRCHGANLRTAEGETIRADCDLCHKILAQGPVHEGDDRGAAHWTGATDADLRGLPFVHPIDIDGSAEVMGCWECHGGDDTVYLDVPARVAQVGGEGDW